MAISLNRKNAPEKTLKTPGPTTLTRSHTGAGEYGQNLYDGPSSIEPGLATRSPLAQNLKESSDDGEGALDAVINRGVKRGQDTDSTGRQYDGVGDSLLRDIGKNNVADHPGMTSNRQRQSGGTDSFKKAALPSKVGDLSFEPTSIRKPGAQDEIMRLNGFDAQSLSDAQHGRRRKR
jgi:hypothetical protein